MPKPWTLRLDPDFLRHFEAVSLLLRDHLRLYPPTILKQVETILDKNVERVFAILSTFSRREVRRMLRPSLLESFAKGFPFVTIREGGLSRANLFEARIALNRLAQIVRYAASVQLVDYDIDIDELADHYDPKLLDKPKLLALINLLKVQIGQVPDSTIRDRLMDRIDRLEDEIRKPRPRWGRVIAGFFVLYSFVADVRTISPGAYDVVYNTISAIVATLHQDGGVQHRQRLPLLPEGSDAGQSAIIPKRIVVPKPDDAVD